MEANFTVEELMSWEDGTMSEHDEIDLFQRLLNCRADTFLQGMYGRHMRWLLDAGLITRGG